MTSVKDGSTRMKRIGLALLMIGLVAAGGIWWSHYRVPTALGHQGKNDDQNQSNEISPGPTDVYVTEIASFSGVNQIEWVLRETQETSGVCVEMTGTRAEEYGSVSGCGPKPSSDFTWSTGGVELGGSWYSVAFGKAPEGATDVTAQSGDGSAVDAHLVGGYWVALSEADSATNGGREIRRVTVLDAAGSLLFRKNLPSLAEIAESSSQDAEIDAP